MSRCLYKSSFAEFINANDNSIFGALCDNYHGEALTATREAWKAEISIMKDILSQYKDRDGRIVFEYDIPRLGKRLDVVLLLEGIIFCLEFKVGESRILEADIDQVLDYALDLKNFHKFSQDNLIVPILIATNYRNSSTDIQMSVYDDRVVNPLVTGALGVSNLIAEVLKRFPNETSVNYNWIIRWYLSVFEELGNRENMKITEVVAALIWENDKFMICQRPAHKARGLLWEFVGGKVEPGETKEQALIRECREELNILLSVGDVFMDVVHEYPDMTVHLTLFNATIAEGIPQKLEHNDIKWITPSKIPNYEFCPADEEILKKIIEVYL